MVSNFVFTGFAVKTCLLCVFQCSPSIVLIVAFWVLFVVLVVKWAFFASFSVVESRRKN